MKSRRRGVSLVEMLVAVAMSGIVLVTGVGLIHMLLGIERTTRKSVYSSTVASRLSRVFRDDVHAATQTVAEKVAEGSADHLQLQMPGGRVVVYETRSNQLTRVESVHGQTRHHDQFIFPASFRVALQRQGAPNRVAVLVRQPAGSAVAVPTLVKNDAKPGGGLVLRIEATLARDYRYASIASTTKVALSN